MVSLILGLCGLWGPGISASILGSNKYSVFLVFSVEMAVMSVGSDQGFFIFTVIVIMMSVANASSTQENIEISL